MGLNQLSIRFIYRCVRKIVYRISALDEVCLSQEQGLVRLKVERAFRIYRIAEKRLN
jgi:hypothetical protein